MDTTLLAVGPAVVLVYLALFTRLLKPPSPLAAAAALMNEETLEVDVPHNPLYARKGIRFHNSNVAIEYCPASPQLEYWDIYLVCPCTELKLVCLTMNNHETVNLQQDRGEILMLQGAELEHAYHIRIHVQEKLLAPLINNLAS